MEQEEIENFTKEIENFKSGYHKVTVSTEAIRSYFTLPWDNPKEFQTVFEERSKGFLQENSVTAIEDVVEQEYSNVRFIDVLWKPFKYNYALRQVSVRLERNLNPSDIQDIFNEAKLEKDGKEATAEEFLRCETPDLRDNLRDFVQDLIAAQIFFNRISYSHKQKMAPKSSINVFTKLTTYDELVERYFSNLKSHKSPLDIETYLGVNDDNKLEDDDLLMPRKSLSDFFRIMFSPQNIYKSDVPANRPKAGSSDTAEGIISTLFENSASVVNVDSLMISLLKTSQGDAKDKGASYKIDLQDESYDTKRLPLPLLKENRDNGTIEEEKGSTSVIRSDFKVRVKSKSKRKRHTGKRRTVSNPLLIELKSCRDLPGLFDKLFVHSKSYKPEDMPHGSAYWFNLLNQALTYAQASLSPYIMISNMLHAFIIKLPLKEQINADLRTIFSKCDIYGPVNLRSTPVSLLVSVIVFKGTIEQRKLLKRNKKLRQTVVRFSQLKRSSSMHSYLWTYGAPEKTGKRKRDIERYKISMEAFNLSLNLDLPGASNCSQKIFSKLKPNINALRKKVKGQVGFYIRKNEGRFRPPTEPVVRQTGEFVVEKLLKGGKFYSGDLATTFVVREMNHEKKHSPKNTILKIFDPVKLNCIEGDDEEMPFAYIAELSDYRFSHNVYCLITECFLREVSAYLLLEKKLESYSDYVPGLLSYGFLENKSIRDDSITPEKLYDHYIIDDLENKVLNQQGGFVLIEHLVAVKNPEETIDEDERVEIAKQGVNALREIHSASILHGDIKEDNVIVTKSNTGKHFLKIIDFGHSRTLNTSPNANDGTELNVHICKKRGADAMGEGATDSSGDNEATFDFFEQLSKDEMEQVKSYEMNELKKVLVDMLGLSGVKFEW